MKHFCRMPLLGIFFLILSLISHPSLFGQQITGEIDFNNNPELLFAQLQNQKGASIPVLIHLNPGQVFKPTQNLKVQSYVGTHILLISVSLQSSLQDIKNANIRGWAILKPSQKLSPIWKKSELNQPEEINVLISVMQKITRKELEELLQPSEATLKIRQNWENQNIWEVQIAKNKLMELASISIVTYIQPSFTPKKLNNQAIGMTNTEIAHQPISIGGYNLSGENVTVGVGDNGDAIHIDFIDRTRSFNPMPPADHGIHTTGTVGGNGIKDERYKGFAPKSNLISDFFNQIIANAAIYRNDFGMTVTSNSYALLLGDCGYAGTYDLYSQYLDQQAHDLPDVLNVFAAANDGAYTCNPFPQGYGTVTGSYSTAKNVLTVANIGKTRDKLTQSSSRGPVKDGRLKPEITAVGSNLISTITGNDYSNNTGTSMSTPNVAGAAALLIQQYKQLFNNQLPNNALIKNLLMNGADDIDIPGPDFRYGFGLMNLGNSLKILNQNQYFSNQINQGQTQSINIQIPPNVAKAKIMLNWNDPASFPLSSRNLVNDLDLWVTDPANLQHRPLILNPNPGMVSLAAMEGIDTLNNVEQVTITNPAPGNYTISVKGQNMPVANQKYFVSFSFDTTGVALQYPFGGEAIASGDSIYIYWQASQSNQNFQLSYSVDDGINWIVLNNAIASDKRAYVWHISGTIASSKCRVKIQRNSSVAISQNFTILARPVVQFTDSALQCPGSLLFTWSPVTGIDSFQVFQKIGVDMIVVGITTDTFFQISGLTPDSTYWLSVAPVKNGIPGMRSVAISAKPNSGNCSAVNLHGDLSILSIIKPVSGRMLSSTELSSSEQLLVKVQNLDNLSCSNYQLSYQFNNGSWQTVSFVNLLPGEIKTLNLGSLNLSAPGDYLLKVAIKNLSLADPIAVNDTLETIISQIPNLPISVIPKFEQNFEDFSSFEIKGRSKMGIGNSYWDFETNQAAGRIRSFVSSNVTISGNKSMSMDNAINTTGQLENSSHNQLTGTFNLDNYNIFNDEIRCSFDYLLSGVPKFDTGNEVWIRGNDTLPWIFWYRYQYDSLNPGLIFSSGSLSLNDALLAAGQSFSTSTQIRFDQKDTSKIAGPDFGNGLTLDNFELYTVQNDVAVVSIDSLPPFNCALGNDVPLTVHIKNGVNYSVYNIEISYQLDNQPVVTELIDSLEAKDSLHYTFNQTMDLSLTGYHYITVWITTPNDSYALNDSIVDFTIRTQATISNFPYLENFENGRGGFYTEGHSSSWAWGDIHSAKITHAASGDKAWKTNLGGNYNNMELSYLYSPCFDISQLQNPRLSFSLAMDIEEPGDEVFDFAYLEYTTNGLEWHRLESNPQTYNWYNNEVHQVWAKQDETYWKVATTPLPQIQGAIAFRFAFRSDQAANFEGIAVDDIHIYDFQYPIFSEDSVNHNGTAILNSNEKKLFLDQNQIRAEILNGSSSLNDVIVQSYGHDHYINMDSTQYFLPRSFAIKTSSTLQDTITVRLFVPDEAMKIVREDTICYSCSKPVEVYQLGISKYHDADPSKENNLLTDNLANGYTFIPKGDFFWVPYDKGYYAEVKVNSLSEFWFNDGGPAGNQALSSQLFDFQVSHFQNRYAQLKWHSMTDEQTTSYTIQRAEESLEFQTISTIPAVRDQHHIYDFIDTPQLKGNTVFYRILYHNDNGKTYQSLIRQLNWKEVPGSVSIYPNPVSKGIFNIVWFKGNNHHLEYALYNTMGQILLTGKIEENLYNGQIQINVNQAGISAGVYLLKVRSGKEHWEFKIVFL